MDIRLLLSFLVFSVCLWFFSRLMENFEKDIKNFRPDIDKRYKAYITMKLIKEGKKRSEITDDDIKKYEETHEKEVFDVLDSLIEGRLLWLKLRPMLLLLMGFLLSSYILFS